MLGRLIGLVYFFPLIVFFGLGKIRGNLGPKLAVGLILGGLQGLMGWYMVQSGLIDMPRVSHYRLAAHLLLAMMILVYLYWIILELEDRTVSFQPVRRFNYFIYVLSGFSVLQILYGAFSAGSRAGYVYNTFPLMNESLIAEAVFYMDPWWINLFESTATIQFLHRWIGAFVLILAATVCWISFSNARLQAVRRISAIVLAVFLCQFLLGVFTLINVVPLGLASLHQFGACVVLIVLVRLVYLVRMAQR